MADTSTILLVDDEDSIQKLLTYPLERDGFKVVHARDGEEALARFAEEDVDLVVLDLMLPKLDGLEVCKRLRARDAESSQEERQRDEEPGPAHEPRVDGPLDRAAAGARARRPRSSGRRHFTGQCREDRGRL